MQRSILLILSVLLAGHISMGQSRHDTIKTQLKLLENVIGTWNVQTEYTPRTGAVRKETGTYQIKWVLDSTYLQWSGELTNSESGRTPYFMSMISFDENQNTYRQTYFFSRTVNEIVEIGNYDASSSTFYTYTTLTLSDGTIEYLRNELSLSDPNKLVYRGWAKFNNANEVNNFTATMTRKE